MYLWADFPNMRYFKEALFSLAVVIYIGCTACFGQKPPGTPQPAFRNFSIDQGLPSSETYDVYQDRQGYIWVCTDRGVARYNGHRFQVFTTENGLIDNVVFRIYEDPKGRLWFISKGMKLCYYDRGKFIHYRYNAVIERAWPSYFLPDKSLAIDSADNVYFSSQHIGALKIDKYGHLQPIPNKMHSLAYQKVGTTLFWWSNSNYWLIKDYLKHTKCATLYRYTGSKTHKLANCNLLAAHTIRIIALDDDELMTSNVNHIYSRKYNKDIWQEDNIIALKTTGEEIWIGALKKGVTKFRRRGDQLIPKARFLEGLSVSGICRDKEGGYWFSTLESGVFYCPSLAFLSYGKEHGLIDSYVSSIGGIGGKLFVGYMCDNWQELTPPYRMRYRKNVRGNTIIGASNGKVYACGTNLVQLDKPKDVYLRIWFGDCYKEKKALLVSGAVIFRLHDSGKIDSLYDANNMKLSPMRAAIAAVMSDNRHRIWAGNYFGLFEVRNKTLVLNPHADSLFRSRISDLAYHPSWGSIAATRGKGIFCFDGEQILRRITENDGLLSNQLNCLLTEPDGGIWAGSSSGLNYISKGKNGRVQIRAITVSHGLVSNEITSLYRVEKYLWVGTKNGITRIDLTGFRSNKPSDEDIHFASLATSKKLFTGNLYPFSFPNDEKLITIRYDILNYRMSGTRQMAFRLSPTAQWQYSKIPEIALSNLASGTYEVAVKYLNEEGLWSAPKTLCSFSIAPPFWATWYFITGMVLLLLAIAFLLFRLRLRQLTRRHSLQKKMNQLEQKALRAQMNPHFIFNALNSIQSFLLYEENDKAEKYLLQFASLIRETLNNSRESYISIASEMRILEKYLDLERMRFKQKFVYSIHSELTQEELHYGVPPMLIQPYVENAVLHGFPRIETGGQIEIRFIALQNSRLTCTVTDNGIGRKASARQSRGDHKSFGTTITAERLNAFQEKYGDHFSIEIVDHEKDELALGTEVILNIPVISPADMNAPPAS